MQAGSDEPQIDFNPKNVIIGKRQYKQIWLDNYKDVESSFFNYFWSTGYKGRKLDLPMSNGYRYYAIMDENGLPTFYKRGKIKWIKK